MAKDQSRTLLREFVKRRTELETKRTQLETAQSRAAEAVRAADAKLSEAQRAMDEARTGHSADAARALIGGAERIAPVASASRQRAALLDAEDSKSVATRALENIDDQLAKTERALGYMDGKTEMSEALRPYIADLLAKNDQAETIRLQCVTEIKHLFESRLIPAELAMAVNLSIGLAYGDPPGLGKSKVRAPSLSALQAFLMALPTDADAPAPVMNF